MDQKMDSELFELANTRYVESGNDDDDSCIETARSVDSCVFEPLHNDLLDIANSGDENFSLNSYFKSTAIIDEAAFLLEKLKTCDPDDLNNCVVWNELFYLSQKWSGTKQSDADNTVIPIVIRDFPASELELVYYVLNKIENRPKHLHFKCKRLTERDIQNVIQKCLTVNPPYLSQGSLFRVTVKTEMPLGQFLRQLDDLSQTTKGFEIKTGIVTALLEQNNMVYRLLSPEIHEYAKLENILSDNRFHKMNSIVRIECAIRGRNHVRVNISFNNDFNGSSEKRIKTIDIEQQVWNLNPKIRRVTFAPVEENIIHEYEIPDNVPFIPLIRSKRQILNLVDYLNMAKTNLCLVGFNQ